MALLLTLLSLLAGPAAIAGPPDWQAPPTGAFPETMSITGVVQVSGVELRNSGDRLAAFVDGEVRGVASPTIVGNRRMFFLSVAGGPSDGLVSFKAYDAVGDRVLDLQPELAFDSASPRGAPSSPLVWTPRVGGGPPDWSVNPAAFSGSMTVTARVVRAGVTVTEDGARVGAFLDGEVRGSASLSGSLASLTVHGNDAETGAVSFRVYLPSLDQTVSAPETTPFDEGTSVGSAGSPFELTIAPGPTLTGTAGWRMLAPAGASSTVDALLGPLWTQGFPGSDASGGAPNVYVYDETTGGYVPAASASSSWARGMGRFVYVYADDDPTTSAVDGGFPKALPSVGLAPSGLFTFTLTRTPDNGEPRGPGWNLLGNPFDQAIDWDDAGWTKTGVSNCVYVWDPNHLGGSYRVWNGTAGSLTNGIVPAGNAFWVEATAATPALDVAESAKVGFVDVLGVSTASSTGVIALHLHSEDRPTLGAEAFVTFEAEGTAGLDARDAWVLRPFVPNYLSLGVVTGDRQLAIDARGLSPSGTAVYPLAVEAVTDRQPVAERLVLSWPRLNVPLAWDLELVDTQTGTRVDLRRDLHYAFGLAATASVAETALAHPVARHAMTHRFELRVTTSGATAIASPATGQLTLMPPAPNPTRGATELAFELATAQKARLTVTDVLGREVAVVVDGPNSAGRHVAQFDGRGMAPGVYVVRLVSGDETRTLTLTLTR